MVQIPKAERPAYLRFIPEWITFYQQPDGPTSVVALQAGIRGTQILQASNSFLREAAS